MMNEEQRYLFDLQGFLVVPNLLTPEEVAALNATLDERDIWAEAAKRREPDQPPQLKLHTGPVLEWGQAFRDLVSDPRLIPYLRELVGDKCRLDHEYAIFMKREAGELRLHGGGTPYDPAQYYHFRNERMYCGLTVFSWCLTDSGGELGGFCGIPGSHKSNLPCPQPFKTLERQGPWLHCPEAPAGSLVIFTEALTHGTLPWNADHERRSLLFKYSPGHQSWSPRYQSQGSDLPMDEVGRRLMEPPYHGRREVSLPSETPPPKDDYPG
jgi:hypothetical protein